MGRRTVLKSVAALAVGNFAFGGRAARAAQAGAAQGAAAAGDFAFLAGEWRIANRMMHEGAWIEFPGEASVHSVLAGNGSIEELRIPARNFSGLGIRLYDPERRAWKDHWVNGQQRVVNDPMYGTFENGVGTFIADDNDNGVAIKSRGVWDRITPTSCRWHQILSRDGGATWADNWTMAWTRV
jgi:hypothetical protein